MNEKLPPQPQIGDDLHYRYPAGITNRPPGLLRTGTVASISGHQMALWVLDPDAGNQYFRVDVRDYGLGEGEWMWPDKA
jgi:hypothetical protein